MLWIFRWVIVFAILAVVVIVIASAIIGGAVSYVFSPYFSSDTINITGRITKPDGASFLNDRLIILFLDENEIGRAVTHLGSESDGNVANGNFSLRASLPYAITQRDISSSIYLPSYENGILHTRVGEVPENTAGFEFRLPSKKQTLILKVVAGNSTHLGDAYLRNGSTVLSTDGFVMLRPSLSPAVKTDVSNIVAENVEDSFVAVEKIEKRLDNCRGNQPLDQRSTEVWDYATEAKTETGVTVGLTAQVLTWLGVQVSTSREVTNIDTRIHRHSEDLLLHADPRSAVQYTVHVDEIWQSGVGVTKDNPNLRIPFRNKKGIRFRIASNPAPCG